MELIETGFLLIFVSAYLLIASLIWIRVSEEL